MNRFRSVRVVGLLVVAALAFILAPIAPARAAEADLKAALDLVPADATVVFVVPHAAKLNKKISDVNTAMALGLPDALAEVKAAMGANEGMRDDGPILFVLDAKKLLENYEAVQKGQQPPNGEMPGALIVPVSDYAKFVGNWEGKAEDPAATSTLNLEGRPAYARKVDTFAVMGPDKAIVEAYKPARDSVTWLKNAGKLGSKYLTDSDIALIVNVQGLSASLQPHLKEMIDGMNQAAVQVPLLDPATTKAFVQVIGNAVTASVRDASSLAVTADLSDKGLGLNWAIQFKPGSPAAKLFPGAQGTGAAGAELLKHLPAEKCLFATTMNPKAVDFKSMMDEVIASLPTDLDPTIVQLIKGAQQTMSGKITAAASAQYVMQGAAQVSQVTLIQADDPQGLVQAYRQQIEALGKIDAKGDPNKIAIATKYTAKADTVDGIPLDAYELTITLPASMTANNPALQMLGAAPTTGYFFIVDKYLVQAQSMPKESISGLITSIKKNDGVGASKGIATVRNELPSDPAMEGFLNLQGVVDMAAPILAMMGAPPIQVPADLPPVAGAVGVEDGGIAGRLYVPMATATFVKDQVQNIAPRMNPGGAPGGRPPF